MFCLFVCLCVMFWLFIFKWKGTYTLRCSEIYLFSFPSTYTVSHNTQHTPWFCHLLFLLLTVPSLHPSLQGNIQRQKTLCLRHQPVIWKVKHISQENALAAFTWQKKKMTITQFWMSCTCNDKSHFYQQAVLGVMGSWCWWCWVMGWIQYSWVWTNCSDLISTSSSPSLCLMDLYVCLCILCDTELYLLVNKITMSS